MDDMEDEGIAEEGSSLVCPHCGGKIVCSKDVSESDKLEEARSAVREKMQQYMSEDDA